MIWVGSGRGGWSGWCGWLLGRRREWGMGNREREDVGTELTLSSRVQREPPGDGRVEGSSRSRDASTGTLLFPGTRWPRFRLKNLQTRVASTKLGQYRYRTVYLVEAENPL